MDQREQKNKEELVIDLWEIWAVVSNHLIYIIPVGIIMALIAMLYTKMFITPQYVSTTKMVVLNTESSSTLTGGDLQTSTFLIKDYVELIKNRNVSEAVIAQLGLNTTHEGLMSKISVQSPEDTRIVAISVRDSDPYMAAKIADTVREVAARHIKEVLEIVAVNVVERANIPTGPVSPNIRRNGLQGGLLGVVISLAFVVVTYLLNDTIQTSEDVERYLDISFLGNIPLQEDEKPRKRKKKAKSGKKKKK